VGFTFFYFRGIILVQGGFMYQDLLKDPKLKPVADALVQQFKSENPISQIKTLIRAFCANGYADKTREVDFNTPEEAALTMLEVCSETEYNLNENYYARVEAWINYSKTALSNYIQKLL
jgi:hypothetical protein